MNFLLAEEIDTSSLVAPTGMADISRDEDKEFSPCLSKREDRASKMWGAQRRIALDVLMACWGLGTWLGVNGLYVQVPLLVERLPEGWALPSHMVLAVQLANVGLPAYALLRRLCPRTPEAACIAALLALGTAALALNALLHERTTPLAGAERSLAFLALTFCAALVGCTSSVLFYPYLRHFREAYLVTYLAGEGLGGLVPSVLALAQGAGGEPECVPSALEPGVLVQRHPAPRFSTAVFLLLLAALSAGSLLSFLLLAAPRNFKAERVPPAAAAKAEEARSARGSLLSARWLGALALTAALNALANGALPSIQSYSCMPYGRSAYHLAVALSAMANPVACLAGAWLAPLSARALGVLLGAAALPLGYIWATALLSPAPPLAGAAGGAALLVAAWVSATGAVSYGRMWLCGWARRGGARGMRALGVATQLGSALGSALLFVLINYVHLFEQRDPCAPPL